MRVSLSLVCDDHSALFALRLYGPLPLVLGERAGRGAIAGDSLTKQNPKPQQSFYQASSPDG
jgi:hypothetical protein